MRASSHNGAGADFRLRIRALAQRLERGIVPLVARAYRPLLARTRFVGVTGSCGKTTTKELIAAVLSRGGRTHRSFDSNNIFFSAARTVLETRPWDRNCVIELGANGPGSLEPSVRLVAPHVAVVTTIGLDHYKSFRGMDAAAAEKSRLVASVPQNGVAVLNRDDPRVMDMAPLCRGRVVSYGLDPAADVRGTIVRHRWPEPLMLRVRYGREEITVPTRLYGPHMATPILAALAAGVATGMTLADGAPGIEEAEPVFGRMSPLHTSDGVTFVHDHFKAPLWSMDAVVEFLAEAQARRTVLVVGTLSDYAGQARRKYEQLARRALDGIDQVVFCGRLARSHLRRLTAEYPERLHAFDDVRQAAVFLKDRVAAGDLVLLKGSLRADHLERISMEHTGVVRCWENQCGREVFCHQCEFRDTGRGPGDCGDRIEAEPSDTPGAGR